MTRLPFHVSLKQPFVVPSLEEMENLFDKFAKEVSPIEVNFGELVVYPNNAIGGEPSGCLSIKIKKTLELDGIQKKLFSDLERKFGPCPAPFDDDKILPGTYFCYKTVDLK